MSGVNDVVIIGGGVAGLSAGLYAARWRMKAVLIEKMAPGGQIINADVIENYPGFPNGINGVELVTALEEHASKSGLEYSFGEVVGLDIKRKPMVVKTHDEQILTKSVIIAVGSEHAKLGVPGEHEYEGRGVSTCATCDGAFFQGKDIVVVGGGDAAMDEGLYLTKMVNSITVVHHKDKLQAQKVYQERAQANKKMKFMWDSALQSINGANGGVTGVTVRNLKTEEKTDLPVSGVFVFVGMLPNTAPFKGVVPMDAAGHIKVDLKMATEVPGVFAVGDCRWQSARQLANHAGDGVTAAFSAHEYVQKG